MKKYILSVFLAFCAISITAQTPTSLKLNLEKGKVYTIRVTNDQNTKFSYNGQDIAVNNKSNNVSTFKLLKQVRDTMELEFRFDTITNKTSSPMMNMETNSTKPGKEPQEKIMNKLSTYKLIAKISTAGKFIGFVNYKQFRDNVMLVMDSIPASKKDDAKKLADGILKESSLQSMVAPLFAYLPEKAVKIGDTWESSYLNSADKITFVMLNTYTLKDLDKKLGTISGTSEIETMPSNDPNALISMDMKGTTQIDGNIDVLTGLSLKTTAKNIIEGTMVTKNNGDKTKIPMKIEGSTETIMIK